MTEQTRKEVFDCPLTLLLTDNGYSYYRSRNKKLVRYRLVDGAEYYGLKSNSLRPADLQKMFLIGFLSKIEAAVGSVVERRQTVVDLSKLLCFAVLYRQFATDMFTELSRSDLLADWNRSHPKHAVSAQSKDAPAFVEYLTKNREKQAELKRALLLRHWANTERDESLRRDERRVRVQITERFLDSLDPATWFLLTVYRDTAFFRGFEPVVDRLLAGYRARSEIPEYLSMVIIELLLVLARVRGADGTIIESEANDVFVVWHFAPGVSGNVERFRLRIVMSNRQTEFQELKGRIEEKTGISLSEKSIQAFYDDYAAEYGMPDLGLYYIAYLKDECRKCGISFDSFVNQDPKTGATLINLVLAF